MRSVGRTVIAVAFIAFGIQHLYYGKFVTRIVPGLSAPSPAYNFWAYPVGVLLVFAGSAILLGWKARNIANLLGALVLASTVLLYPHLLAATSFLSGVWTNAGKGLALSGAALLVAGSLRKRALEGRPPEGLSFLEWLMPAARYFVAVFLILAGIQHFLFAGFVATLVPAWIPGHLFWTYFAGVALIVGGVGITVPITSRLAGALAGIMILLWVVLLHIPRALAAPHDANETTAVFEALAIGGAGLLIASERPTSAPRD
jgi:uncharacterized membrane protein